jgi:hypothetical protein
VIWNKENLATYLTKGTKLYVEGGLQTRSYDGKEGKARGKKRIAARPRGRPRLAIAIGNPIRRRRFAAFDCNLKSDYKYPCAVTRRN